MLDCGATELLISEECTRGLDKPLYKRFVHYNVSISSTELVNSDEVLWNYYVL